MFTILTLSSLAAGSGCLGDDSLAGSETDVRVERLAQAGHDAVFQMPRVERVALTAADHPAALSGDLGTRLEAVASTFGLADSKLALASTRVDELGIVHERYQQTRFGLPVVGGDLRIGRDAYGTIVSAIGAGWDLQPGAPVATVTETQARDVAMSMTPGAITVSAGDLVYLVPSDGSTPRVTWRFRVEGTRDGLPMVDDLFIDGLSAELADRHPRVHSARIRETYDANNTEDTFTLVREEGDGPSGDGQVDAAHDHAGRTYDCLLDLFGRDSYDGAGADLISVAHFGQNLRNAFWNGQAMFYGDGFAVADVGTHEFVHGVTTSTANMVYQNEPGALNEAWSDILTAVCDVRERGTAVADTWTIGEELPIEALRFLDDPRADGISRDHYSELYTGTEDEGGVHINSGIANLAFYLLSTGGRHPAGLSDTDVVAIGTLDAGQIFYRALVSYMGPTTDFEGARVATELAAADLYGEGSSEAISVSEAWSAVGVGGPAPARVEPEPEPGTEPGDDDTGSSGNSGTGSSKVVGGCSAGGTGTGGAASLLLLAVAAALGIRRRRSWARE